MRKLLIIATLLLINPLYACYECDSWMLKLDREDMEKEISALKYEQEELRQEIEQMRHEQEEN